MALAPRMGLGMPSLNELLAQAFLAALQHPAPFTPRPDLSPGGFRSRGLDDLVYRPSPSALGLPHPPTFTPHRYAPLDLSGLRGRRRRRMPDRVHDELAALIKALT